MQSSMCSLYTPYSPDSCWLPYWTVSGCLFLILIIHEMLSLAKFAALNSAMNTPHRMATEFQGFAVTIWRERMNNIK
ncbi:hypothetical protein CRUP_031302 [Coryphaenoides rupestris]|nr:hypothetical protein CRUP_031302 [Coryphaenoides rupestris]